MNRTHLNIIGRFIILVLLQVVILERLNLHGFINPYIYPLFLLLLPFGTAKWLLLLLGFFLGITIDMFTNTMGIHAASCVFVAFIRPFVIDILNPSGGYEQDMQPTIKSMGFNWFFSYTLLLLFFHHFSLFFLETFRLTNFFNTFSKAFLSLLFSTAIILIIQFMTFSKKRYH